MESVVAELPMPWLASRQPSKERKLKGVREAEFNPWEFGRYTPSTEMVHRRYSDT